MYIMTATRITWGELLNNERECASPDAIEPRQKAQANLLGHCPLKHISPDERKADSFRVRFSVGCWVLPMAPAIE